MDRSANGDRPTDRPLAGRSAVVTGSSRGIGRAVARAFVDAGAIVGMVARTESELERTAEEIGGHALRCDIASASEVQALAARVEETLGGWPDIVVNSAGAFSLSPLAEAEPQDFDDQIAANLRGPFLMMRTFLPRMLARRRGHIVNIGSIAGRLAMPGNAIYSASKFGLRGMHSVLEQELRGSGVRSTLIEPSATDTPLWDPLNPDSRTDLPSRAEMLRPEEVAAAVLFAVTQPEGVELSHLAIRPARSLNAES